MSPVDKSFSDWDLDSEIADAISNKGWTIPTDIQVEAIPVARAGRDVVGQARTGSGKTAAFGIPIIEACQATGSPQAIVLCPTRELAVQVAEEISWLQGGLGMSVQTVYGGTDIEKQAKLLDKGADIIVGTPGRVIDMAKRGHLKLADIHRFCLDEADRMLLRGPWPLGERPLSTRCTLARSVVGNFTNCFKHELLSRLEFQHTRITNFTN
jgi:ATP-dependent RNA helicase DeaD